MELRVCRYCKVHSQGIEFRLKSNFVSQLSAERNPTYTNRSIKPTINQFYSDCNVKIIDKYRIFPPILSRQNSLSDYQFTYTVSGDLMQQKQKMRKVFWTPQEDALLKELAIEYKSDWIQISKFIPNRNASQCSQRWKRIKPVQALRNKIWTKEEDQNLLSLVQRYGKKWHIIAKEISFRTSIQVRERYLNHLDPQINKDPWNTEEDEKLWQLYLLHGSKWSLISREFQGRPAYMVKNRFYGHVRSSCGNQLNPYYTYRPSAGESSCEEKQLKGVAFSLKGMKKTTKTQCKADKCRQSQASFEDDLSKYFVSLDSESRSSSPQMQLSEKSDLSPPNKMAIQLEQTESNCKDLLIVSHDFQQSMTQKADINESNLEWELNNSIFDSPGPTFD